MKASYYWPSVFKDAHFWVRRCQKCVVFVGKERLVTLPLQPIQVDQPFMKWGLDFIGAINPPSSAGHKWFLIATDYFTKWTEAVALKDANASVLLNFYEDLVCRFGVPDSIILDNALAFAGNKIS